MKELETLSPVAPVRTLAGYIGGKRALSSRLVPVIAATPHDCYVEPFVGMGGIFFRRDRRPKAEVINDISADVTNLFRLLQRHYQQLLDVLKWQITSRADFERLVKVEPETLTELERAARFLFIQRLSFGGKVMGRTFGTSTTGPARFDLTKLVPMLEDVHERLASVTIERLSYDRLIPRYDRPHTLFYLDPPYWGCTDDYGRSVFSEDDFERLSGLLRIAKGRFILSINDVPEVREIFAWASIEPVELNYRVSGKVTAARELVIRGPNSEDV
ncbi:DNA adenine methylase [Sphingobium sp. TB-6]|uniref:DNA adenine methylase n=1 Tax=Sphingobium sp. TB-6 TaxID=2728850 RepID=UPI00146CECB7|nr:DNA adenine methylase [Sphingobium sp. TB-6]NML88338.1 DNA adenine methylase [Sphingobium sp. TB-6]